jgi:hypothetical protein
VWLPRRNDNGTLRTVPALLPAAGQTVSGVCGLADRDQQLVADLGSEGVVLLLKPVKRGLEVTHPLLKTPHF